MASGIATGPRIASTATSSGAAHASDANQREDRNYRTQAHGFGVHTLTIFTAHFLKSVWNEIGSVASSVTLLMSWLASNHGTNTVPAEACCARASRRGFACCRAAMQSPPARHVERPARRRPRDACSTPRSGTAAWSSGTRRVIEPECQCSSTRPVDSQNGYSLSGISGGGSSRQREDPRLAVGEPVELEARHRASHRDRRLRGTATTFHDRRRRRGQTLLHDWVYENRAIYLTELTKLGASVKLLDPHRVMIEGPTRWRGTEMICPPALRPAVVILLAMLASKGTSVLRSVYVINRGYEDLAHPAQRPRRQHRDLPRHLTRRLRRRRPHRPRACVACRSAPDTPGRRRTDNQRAPGTASYGQPKAPGRRLSVDNQARGVGGGFAAGRAG